MSSELYLMKNLIDMGIIDRKNDNIIESEYHTPDGNYIFLFKRKPRLSFLSEDSISSYICDIQVLSNLSIPLLSIQTTEIEISKLLDTFYNMIEYDIGSSVYHYFNPNTTNCISKIMALFVTDDCLLNQYNRFNLKYTQILNKEYNLAIYDKIDDQLVSRIITPMNQSSMNEFLEKLFYTFLIDVPYDVLMNYQ